MYMNSIYHDMISYWYILFLRENLTYTIHLFDNIFFNSWPDRGVEGIGLILCLHPLIKKN